MTTKQEKDKNKKSDEFFTGWLNRIDRIARGEDDKVEVVKKGEAKNKEEK